MSASLWKKINSILSYAALFFVVALAVFLANIEIKDLDIWLHLRTGQYILENLSVPRYDIFSCTVAGEPWINHEWLFQVLVHGMFSLFGPDGLITLQVLLGVGVLGVLLMIGEPRRELALKAALLLLILFVLKFRFYVRPDLMSLFFLSLYLLFFGHGFRNRKTAFFLVLIQVIWANTHGFFILGPLMVTILVFTEWLKRNKRLPFSWNEVSRLDDAGYARLAKICPVLWLACLATPYFLDGFIYPFRVMFSLGQESSIFFRFIGELRSPIQMESLFSADEFLAYKALLILSFLSFAFNFRRINISFLVLWCLFLLLSLKAARNMAYFAVFCYPVLLSNIHFLAESKRWKIPFWNSRWRDLTGTAVSLCLIGFIWHVFNANVLRGYYDFDTYTRKSEFRGLSLRSYPHKAVEFLQENNIHGNFYNNFNAGSYMIGHLYPHIKVFIDGRTELYGPELFRQYRAVLEGDVDLLNKLQERYQLTGALLGSSINELQRLCVKRIYDDPNWRLVYFGYDALIFLHDDEKNREHIRELGIDLEKWQVPQLDQKRFGKRKAKPYPYINRARVLYFTDHLEKAEEELAVALSIAPDDPDANNLLGDVYMKRKEYQRANDAYRRAYDAKPRSPENVYDLAFVEYFLENYDNAEDLAGRVIKHDPRNVNALFLLSMIYAKQKMYEDSLQFLRKAHEIDPDHREGIRAVIEIYKEQGQTSRAKDLIEEFLAYDADPLQ